MFNFKMKYLHEGNELRIYQLLFNYKASPEKRKNVPSDYNLDKKSSNDPTFEIFLKFVRK